MSRDLIRGAGGGGGRAASAPVESPDSLRSRQYARVMDVVSEGEIEGLVDGLRSVYLNGTPVQAPDGSYNFDGVKIVSRNGTQSQTAVPGFAASEAEVMVATEVKASAPVVRSVASSNLSAVRVTVSTPYLTYQDSNGNLGGTTVELAIDINNNGGGWQEMRRFTISGKTTSRYQRSYRIDLPSPGPWQVRVRRLTADSSQSNLQNKTFFDSYTEIVDVRLRYPNTALMALQVDAANFSSIPVRGYDIKGLRVKVPTNYNPVTRAYSGVWDGTFKIAWTDNPAWCFYDLLTNARYGLGAYLDASQVDKWSLYEIGKYCDALVPDGYGGMEPRFTCNLYLSSRQEAFTVLQNMASLFRSMIWWSHGAITTVQDAPAPVTALFTPANVIDGQFIYSGSSAKSRHTVALVAWNDPADLYRQKIEYVEDAEGIARYGVQQTEIVAVGCTSRGQAHRLGKWLLYTERMETEQVTFSAGLDAALVFPGAVIQIQDPFRAGKRYGGRIVSATASSVTLDAPVTIESGQTYQISVVLPDGKVDTRAASAAVGERSVLTVTPAYTTLPAPQSIWVLAASNLAPTTWRVLSVSEGDNNTATITALAHNPGKFAAIEQGLVLQPLPVTALRATPPPVSDVTLVESLYLVALDVVGVRVSLSWAGDAPRYAVSWRRVGGGNWHTRETDAPSLDIDDITEGTYEFAVVAISALGARSSPANLIREIVGKVAPPAAISNFTVVKSGGVAYASWDRHVDLDVRVGGRIVIRHSSTTSGAAPEMSVVLDTLHGDATTATLPLMTGTYMAQAVDSSGNWGPSAAFVATEGMVTGWTTVATSVQHPGFVGAKTNTVANDGQLYLAGVDLFDDLSDPIDTWDYVDTQGGIHSFGSYAFSGTLDLGSARTRRYEATISALSFDVLDSIDGRSAAIDTWDDFDGQTINDCDVTLYAQTSLDNVIWSSWAPFFVADFDGRYARFRADLVSGNPSHNIAISHLQVAIKEPV